MTVTLYLDVFFIVNFGMDVMLLYLVKRLLGLTLPAGKPGRREACRVSSRVSSQASSNAVRGAARRAVRQTARLAAGAAVGAAWSCLAVFMPRIPAWAEIMFTGAGVGSAMVLAAFGPRPPREFLRCLAGLWAVTALAGGMLAAVGDAVPAAWYLAGTRAVRQWSVLRLGLAAAGLFFAGRAVAGFWRERVRDRNRFYQVTLHYQGRVRTVTALWDTGNCLYEPYGHRPVHVITYDACRDLCEKVSRVIYIPFSSVGTGYGMLPGIQVDEMDVAQDGKIVQSYERPWLAVSREPLSPRHQYEMLLHGEQE